MQTSGSAIASAACFAGSLTGYLDELAIITCNTKL
jgi:hypothetical protein